MNYNEILNEYNRIKSLRLTLDMSRGKPSTEQLDKLSELLTEISSNNDCYSENGVDCRNYGCLEGIPEAKKMFARILDVEPENVIVCGNSSLNNMYDTISNAFMFGLNGCEPWLRLEKVKFLCPVPGYDRHFSILKLFGFEPVCVDMNADGPDMDAVRKYAESDPSVKGIFCVPRYSNPTGVTFSDDVVRQFAALKPAAKDFAVIWDNAYAVHGFNDYSDKLLSVLREAEKQGSEDMFYIYTSTSKISWSGAGISCVAMSRANKQRFLKIMGVKTIGYDKLAMLRHARLLNDKLEEIMRGHASIIEPKFKLCYEFFEKLEKEIEGFTFTRPNGGYFISVNTPNGKASEVVRLAAEAGLMLTPAGSTFPNYKDPDDRNIRIAPTYPNIEELRQALILFTVCVKLACSEK